MSKKKHPRLPVAHAFGPAYGKWLDLWEGCEDHVAFWAKHSHQPDDYNTITITVYKHTMTGAIRAADHPPGNPASWVVLYTFQHEVTNT
jgi:hypothetical protein